MKAILAALLVAPLAASAANRDFKLHNDTPFDIAAVYFSMPNLDQWIHSDNSQVASGEDGTINFNNDGPCQMQMRVAFTNGHYGEWTNGFNFCSVSEISISYDRLNHQFNATYR